MGYLTEHACITVEKPAINLWSMHGIVERNKLTNNINASCLYVMGCLDDKGFSHIHLEGHTQGGPGIFIPNWQPSHINTDAVKVVGDDLWKINFFTMYYFLRAKDFEILMYLCNFREGKGVWKWHERYSILLENGLDGLKPIKKEIERMCSSR